MEDVGGGPVGLDTCVFIYLLEEHPDYLPIVEPLFAAVSRGELMVVTSGITLLEVLVVPLRAGDRALAARYEAVLLNSRGVHLAALEPRLLRAAAGLRAALNVKTPDALQLAATSALGCVTFVTNDRRLPDVAPLKVLQLADYLTTGP